MKTHKCLSLLAVIGAFSLFSTSHAQVEAPAPSPSAELTQVIGLTKFTVNYSRPGAKDRQVFGELVPYGEVWRTGANASTKISFDSDIEVEGKPLPAGEYALYTIPGKKEWTVIFSNDTSLWGAQNLSKENDAARVTVEPVKIKPYLETFTIGFQHLRDESAILHLDWANIRVPVKITLDTVNQVQASIDKAMENPEDLEAGDYADAASFYLAHDKDLDKAEKWMKKAVSESENAFWWQHTYAKILAKQNKTEEARKMAKTSLKKAKAADGDFGYIKRNEELLSSLE